MKTAMLNNQVVVLDKVANKSQNLCSVANQIRHITKCDTKTAYAKAKEMLAAAEAKTSKKVHSRGKYVRDEAWKAKKAEQMKAYWAGRR